MDDRGSILEFIPRIVQDTSVLSSVSSALQTPRRDILKDFLLPGGQDFGKNFDVYVRVKPGETAKDEEVLKLENNTIILTPPATLAGKSRGAPRSRKFLFTKVFSPATGQKELFDDSVLELAKHFLHGQNTLIFTYGATSAGKTFTMHGNASDAGIIPRSLDVIFNSIGEKHLENLLLKPYCLDDIVRLSADQAALEDLERSYLFNSNDTDLTGSKESISTSTSVLNSREWHQRQKTLTKIPLEDDDFHYSVWVSFGEIYNEQAYDLLEKVQRNRKREILKLGEDKKGKTYIRGLREICVRSADEAYHLIQMGKENLHFAATKLNHNSSRSHCMLTIKVIRTRDPKDPKEASLSVMSFCDLAGMERTAKTESRGDRLKEAGNINTSLLVLGRCLEAIRQNRSIVPFRESKLTRLLQVYFSGQSHAAMFLNVSQSSLLYEETLNVLKFGAKAEDIILPPKRDISVVDVSVSSMFAPPAKPSKFMQFVRKSISRMSTRPSVIEPAPFMPCDEEKEVLLDQVHTLEKELTKVLREKANMEIELRNELCTEWEKIVEQLNETWQKRLTASREMYEKSCENKLSALANYANKCLKRKRTEEEREGFDELLAQKDEAIEDLTLQHKFMEQQMEQMRQALQISNDRQNELQSELTRLKFEKAAAASVKTAFTENVEANGGETEAASQSEKILRLQQQIATKDEMLEEAAIEFQTKSDKLSQLESEIQTLTLKNAQLAEQNSDLKAKVEETEYLLRDANDRLDSKESEISSLEEKLNMNVGQISQLNTQVRQLKRTVRELEEKSTPAASWEEKLATLQAENQRLAEQLKTAEANLSSTTESDKLHKEILRLEIRLREALENVETLEQVKKQQEEDFRMEKECLMDELNHAKKDLELSMAEKVGVDQEVSRLDLENKDLRETLVRVCNELKSLEENREESMKALEAELQSSRNDKRLLDEELASLASSLKRLQESKSAVEKQNLQLTSENEKLLHQIQMRSADTEAIQTLKQNYEELETTYEKTNKTMLKYLRQTEQLSEEVKKYCKQLESKDKELDRFEKLTEDLRAQLEEEKKSSCAKDDEIFKLQQENKLLLSGCVGLSNGADEQINIKAELSTADEDEDVIPPTPRESKGRKTRGANKTRATSTENLAPKHSSKPSTAEIVVEEEVFVRPTTTRRGRRAAAPKVAVDEQETDQDPDSEPVTATKPARSCTKPKRGRPPKNVIPSTDEDDEEHDAVTTSNETLNKKDDEETSTKPRRGRTQARAKSPSVEEAIPKKPTRTNRKVKAAEEATLKHPSLVTPRKDEAEEISELPARRTRKKMYTSKLAPTLAGSP